MENWQIPSCFWSKTYERAELAQNRGFGFSMPKNPYNDLLFNHIDGFKSFCNFGMPILNYLPLLQPWLHQEL